MEVRAGEHPLVGNLQEQKTYEVREEALLPSLSSSWRLLYSGPQLSRLASPGGLGRPGPALKVFSPPTGWLGQVHPHGTGIGAGEKQMSFHKHFSTFCGSYFASLLCRKHVPWPNANSEQGGSAHLRGKGGRHEAGWKTGHVCNLPQCRVVITFPTSMGFHLSQHKRVPQPDTWERSRELGESLQQPGDPSQATEEPLGGCSYQCEG